MTINDFRLLSSALLITAVLCACGSDPRAKALDETLTQYTKTLRWGDVRTALLAMHPDDRPDERTLDFELRRFENVKVTGVRTLDTGFQGESNEYVQLVQLNLVNRHTAYERVVMDRQEWRWDETAERWWLTSGLPDISRVEE